MVDVSGIPRGVDLDGMRRELDALRRQMERDTSRRTFVSLERIVEGGTIDQGVGRQLTKTVQKDIVVERENIADTALNDRVIKGSTVQSEGVARAVYGDGTVRESKVSASLAQRATPWSVGAGDKWPGLWLEGAPIGSPGYTPPDLPAGVTVGDAWGGSLAARSSRHTEAASYGELLITNSILQANVYSAGSGTPGDFHRAQTTLGLGLGRFNLTSADGGGVRGAEVRHDGDGILRLYGKNGVLINGQPPGNGSGEGSGWLTAVYQNGWMDYGNGFGGLQYSKLNGMLHVRGSIKGGAFYTAVTKLPPGFRVTTPEGTSAVEFPITVIANNGTSFTAGTMFAYSDGTLTYYSPPSTWTGPDRVVINHSFPL